jgi:hypothetical protein
MGKSGGSSGCEAMAGQGRAGKTPKGPLMRLYGARNDKPPFGGLTRTGGWFYSRDAMRGVVRIVVGERDCQPPTSLLGNSGRVSNAQRTLNLHRGSQPVGARRQSGSANGNGETREK